MIKRITLFSRRIGAALLLAAVAWSLIDFPRWSLALGAGFVLYLALLWRYPRAWLVVVPAALPLLDLAFWTGRFFFDEFDRLMLVTVAAWLWRREPATGPVARWPATAALLALSVLLGTALALSPWQSVDANAFSSYWSHFNALRVAKGFLWGALLFAMGRALVRPGDFRLLAAGMVAGAVGVSIAAIWETWLFTGFGTASDYRVTATFSSMHTGGGHIEAYLAAVLPFAWYLLISQRNALIRLAAVAAFLLGGYAILTTVARGGLIAFLAVSAVLGAMSLRLGLRHRLAVSASAAAIAMVAAGAVVVALGIAGGVFLKERIAQTAADAGTRFGHWGATVRLMESTPRAWLVGEGLGSFPRRFLYANADLPLGTYRIDTQGENSYLALNSGGTLYMAQAVNVSPNTPYTVELDVRSGGEARALEIALCEKKLFNSHRCRWGRVNVERNSSDWQSRRWVLKSGEVGSGTWPFRRPVQLALYNPQERTVVEIDNVRMLDASGRDVLANGDFEHGLDRWFFKSGDHLPWHVKNLWVHLLFEQGVLGVLAFVLLCAVAGFRLLRRGWRGDMLAATLLAAFAGLMVLGVVDSLVDAPRLAALLVFVLLLGAAPEAGRNARARAR